MAVVGMLGAEGEGSKRWLEAATVMQAAVYRGGAAVAGVGAVAGV